jgi:type I restriction enzyme S subunit
MPFELPKGWVWSTLGEVFTLQAGKNITANKISEHKNDKEPFPCYGGNGIRGYVSNYNRDGLHPIIGRQGALCGNINVARGKFYATEHAVVVDLYATTDSSWATYALIQMNLNQYATATAQPGLSVSTINDAYIVIPPLGEQKRIAKKLDDIFCFIDKIDSQATDLFFEVKTVKAKILDLAIRGKLVPQDPNDEPSIEMLKRLNPDFVASDTSHYENLPHGWCVCALEDIIDYEQPQPYIVESTAYSDDCDTPVLTAGKSFIIGYTNETRGIVNDLPVIIFDDFTTDSKYVDFPFKVKSSAMKILRVKSGVNPRFITMLMSITRLTSDTHKRYWISEYSKITMMLPPIEEQRRIVDKAKELCKQLDLISQILTD